MYRRGSREMVFGRNYSEVVPYSVVWSIIYSGVTPIAFWIRENSRNHEHTSPFETLSYFLHCFTPRVFGHSHPDLFSSETALECKLILKTAQLLMHAWLVREITILSARYRRRHADLDRINDLWRALSYQLLVNARRVRHVANRRPAASR